MFPHRETSPERVCPEAEASPEATKEMNGPAESLGATTDPLDDYSWLIVSPEELEQIHEFFDAPPNPNEQLRRTMSAPRPWQT